MTPEAQHLAVAALCGKRGPLTADYLGDLNAIAAARKLIPADKRALYVQTLYDVVNGFSHDSDAYVSPYFEVETASAFLLADATATQHTEALIRTLGKWDKPA